MSDVFETTPPTLEEVRQSAHNSGYFQLIGLQVENAQDGKGATRLRVDARLLHAQLIVHGGIIFSLADTAMSLALMSVLPRGTIISTIEAKINYLRPVRTGELVAEATVVHKGNTVAVLEAVVYNNKDAAERLPIARTLGTFNIQQNRRS